MKKKTLYYLGLVLIIVVVINSCTKDYLEKPTVPKPRVGVETDTLEASYTTTALMSVNASYWKGADYITADLQDLSTQHLYTDDGCFNLTGTLNGLSDFNAGNAANLKLRAAYDDEFIYILAEWEDNDVDASQKSWLWNGPDDPDKPGSTDGWTSQRNDDNVALAFDIDGASTAQGQFATIGCAASCHSNGVDIMAPETGKVDIWNWSLALSQPLGYAFDMMADATSGLDYDAGQKMFERNEAIPNDNRSGPMYEWDGVSQEVTPPLGNSIPLDASFFLLNKTPFLGDASAGKAIYDVDATGCIGCHGPGGNGNGTHDVAPAFNKIDFIRKYSRSGIFDHASLSSHDGEGRWSGLNPNQRNDVVAYIRGLAGVPGYYLVNPTPGESINDVAANSNVPLPYINPANTSYKVMFKRKLDTGNADDAKFDPSSGDAYVFGVALMDNDGKNHVGSLIEHLIFKEK